MKTIKIATNIRCEILKITIDITVVNLTGYLFSMGTPQFCITDTFTTDARHCAKQKAFLYNI